MRGRHRNLAAELGGWSARHRRQAILGWLAFVVIAFAVGSALGQRQLTDVQMGNGPSKRATAIYDKAFPYHSGEQVLLQGRGPVRSGDRVFTAAVGELVRRLQAIPTVNDIRSPLTAAAGRTLRSADGRSALVTFNVAGDSNQAQRNVDAALAATAATAAAHPQVRAEEFGAASTAKALTHAYLSDAKTAEYISIPVTLIVLVFAFGAVGAAWIPLLLGLTAVVATLGLIGPASRLIPSAGQVNAVVALIGLAVGVDYSMFYLRRKLEERRAGLNGDSALARAAATSGRAVLVSGLTVMTAMAGMFLTGNAVFSSLAIGTMLVVVVAVLGSVTVLPAVIARLGDRVERGRAPVIARRRDRGRSQAWSYVIDRVLRVPALSLALSAGLLVALAIPALSMHTVNPGFAGLPPNLPIMRTYQRIQKAFPGGAIPAVVVVQANDVTAPPVAAAITRMSAAALRTGEMRPPVVVAVSSDRTVAAVTISLAGTGFDNSSDRALTTLRRSIVPRTVGALAGVRAYVGGTTAGSRDFTDTMKAHLPLVFAFVFGLAFVLLLVAFRSIVIPLKTIILNLLSVGAAYGVVTLVFQDGYLRAALGAQDIGGVVDWLPLFLFVVLFGLSMDYHVLILSRVREAHQDGMTTADAVAYGLKSTAGVVTSAAIVMVAMFAIFAILPEVDFKQLGVGLAAAVLIDATIVRAVLLPSAMTLLGEWNWYLPALPAFASRRLARRRATAA